MATRYRSCRVQSDKRTGYTCIVNVIAIKHDFYKGMAQIPILVLYNRLIEYKPLNIKNRLAEWQLCGGI